MKAHLFLILIISVLFSVRSLGQPKSHIKHYGLTEGLSQRTIMNIIQDKKGFIWLATWDGLCKFDGHNFTTYKTFPEDSILMKNNRIDRLTEDAYGYIWVHSYDKEPFRFDPKTEKYVAAFHSNNETFKTSEIISMPSGKVWLTSESMGAICVLDSLNHFQPFSVENKNLPGNKVYTVFEDKDNLSWILTDRGLMCLSSSNDKKDEYPGFLTGNADNTPKVPFFSAIETESELWFGSINGQIRCYNKENKTFTLFETGIHSNIISIKKIYDNLFVILTSKDGFIICDRNRTNLKKFNTSNLDELPTNEMLSCFIDSNNNIWFETNSKGVAKFNIIDNRLKYYKANDYGNNTILFPSFFIIEDKTGHIWVHPHGGFSFYDEKSDRLIPFFNNPFSPDWMFSDLLHHVFLDKQGNIWLSARSGGLEKVVFNNTLFKLNDFYSNTISSTGVDVRSILEDKNNNIWLGNMDGIISIYDSNRNFKGILCEDGTISKSGKPLKGMAYSLLQDQKGTIWVGTKGKGIYALKPVNNTYTSFLIEHYKHNPNDSFSLSHNNVYSVYEDNNGQIWIGTYGGGINRFDRENNRFINHKNNFNNYPMDTGSQIRTIRSYKGKIYVGTTFGLIVLALDKENKNISGYKIYSKAYKAEDGLRANDIHNILITRSNDLYIATFGGGMSKAISWDEQGFPIKFITYGNKEGLHSDIVLSITEDNSNNLWINSEGSISRFNPKEEVFEQFNDVSRAISNQYFMETLPLLTSDGQLIYGCAHGTLSFIPDQITKNTYIPYLALTKFKVSNNDYPLKTEIDDIKEITLNHQENTFSIEYTALDYNDPYGVSYSYKLEGFDTDWIIDRTQRIANYTNIPPGEYVFKVKSTNSNGTRVENERNLFITITPSFWQTGQAYILYAVSFILLLYVILRSIFLFYRMKDRVLLEQEQTEMKTRFFTDISHEIRTPLTMIVSPIENILDNKNTHSDIKPQLHLILRNANRMLKMVNQILDFRKIQKRRLQIKEIPIGPFVESVCNSMIKATEDQEIKITVENRVGNEKIGFDPDAMEKLLFNLVSNSIKHTTKGKKIEINIFFKDKATALQVKDEGEGMSKEVMGKLFTRFASYSKEKNKPSTGIGLSIVKEIADKHHAKIQIESDINKGTCFTVLFQPGLEHFSKDDVEWATHPEDDPTSLIPDIDNESIPEESEAGMSVLVIEDDPELRGFIKSVLKDHYRVYEAKDGKEGYENVITYMPDFILSDIMMPEMDGMELLKKIRGNQNTSHIPVILLTAKTNIDNQLEGILLGANDYITKPFSVKLLIAKIDNIIKQRKLYNDYLTSEGSEDLQKDELITNGKITEQDELFLKNLQEEICNHLDNSEFTIDDLVSNTSLSRRVFFNKVKSLTGLAPVQFVRDIRLKHAARLLKTQQYRIKEVTYMVGFSDIRYFSQCFKEMFGMTPGRYRDQFKNP